MRYQHKLAKSGNPSTLPSRRAWAMLCVLAVVGCSTGEKHPDELKGEVHPQGPSQLYGSAPPGSSASPQTKTTGNIPGIPSTMGPYSNVALASMQDGRPPLAIDDGTHTTGFTPSTSSGPTVVPVPSDSGTPAVANNSAVDILQAQLRARGVQWQKQEAVPDGIRFTCIVPNRVNTESSKIYEATARDLVTAIQAILVQIDQK